MNRLTNIVGREESGGEEYQPNDGWILWLKNLRVSGKKGETSKGISFIQAGRKSTFIILANIGEEGNSDDIKL